MRLLTQLAGCAALASLAIVTGCSSKVPVYPVHGRVNFEGKPMKGGGSISFIPLEKQPGKAAGGEIAPDGTYKMTTHSPGDGSMVGEFRVVISQVTDREPEVTPDGQAAGKPIQVVAPADRIPPIYSDPNNSPLRAKVEARDNEINFDLKRQ